MHSNNDTLLTRLDHMEQELRRADAQMRRAMRRARLTTTLAALAAGAALLLAPHDRSQAQDLSPAGPRFGTAGGGVPGSIGILEAFLRSDENRLSALEAKTAPLSIQSDPLRADRRRGTELFVTGVNMHLVSGSGSTSDGTLSDRSKRLRGLGNLIIGYDENTDDQSIPASSVTFYAGVTGSHNLILGSNNTASSFGGVITGINSGISGPHASILCGADDLAGGFDASVLTGQFDDAGGAGSLILGGSALTDGGPATVVYGH